MSDIWGNILKGAGFGSMGAGSAIKALTKKTGVKPKVVKKPDNMKLAGQAIANLGYGQGELPYFNNLDLSDPRIKIAGNAIANLGKPVEKPIVTDLKNVGSWVVNAAKSVIPSINLPDFSGFGKGLKTFAYVAGGVILFILMFPSIKKMFK